MTKILKTDTDIDFLPRPHMCEILATDRVPDIELCASAYVIIIKDDKVLCAKLNRGVDIPGGHIDPEESPFDAMVREAKEETGAIVKSAHLVGAQKITLKCPRPEKYAYPYPVSYQLFYYSNDIEMGEFLKDEDSEGAIWIDLDKVYEVAWFKNHKELFQEVLRVHKGASKACKTLMP